MKRCLHSWGSIVTLLLPVAVSATTIVVGPSRQYKTLQQVTGLLLPGDTVLVDGDAVYTGGVVFSRPGTAQQRIVIRGVRINGIRPVIDGGTNGVTFMTASPNAADHYTLEGFDVRNASFRGIYHQADDLILRDVVIHGCNNGLMGADNGSGSLLLEYAEIYGCGSGTQAHQIYMATDESTHPGSVFRMQFCYMHDGAGGNNVKSRAERNEIYYNWIEGAYYHELELIGPDPAGPDRPAAPGRDRGRDLPDTQGRGLARPSAVGQGRSAGGRAEKLAGLKRAVADEVVDDAMEAIAAALGDHVDEGRAVSVRGIHEIGHDLEFG